RSAREVIRNRPFFGERRGRRDLVVRAVQVSHAARNQLALEVVPGPVADSRLRVDRAGTQIGVPGFAGRARGLRQRLAEGIAAGEATEVSAFRVRARDEKA